MSERNVELVRSVIGAHERGDFETVFAAYDLDIEWDVAHTQVPISDVRPISRGHDEIRAFWRHWFETWEAVRFEYEDFTMRLSADSTEANSALHGTEGTNNPDLVAASGASYSESNNQNLDFAAPSGAALDLVVHLGVHGLGAQCWVAGFGIGQG